MKNQKIRIDRIKLNFIVALGLGLALILGLSLPSNLQAQYISEVIEYQPAPGQLINKAPWGMPSSKDSLSGKITGSISLGAFGGYVVFKFENPVENHPDNPYGVDFTIFGNPSDTWSEPGIVSVMKDENKNGLPDDTWYELAGSEYFFSSTIKKYSVKYSNPKQETAADVPWTDNLGNSGLVLKNDFHVQPYYPLPEHFGSDLSESLTLSGTRLKDNIDRSNPGIIKSHQKAFGYADNQPRGSSPYTKPDNPYTPEKENSGGDAFDISWAVNENGEYVDLDVIHFVKVHSAILANGGWLGEISTEITGAVAVTPDASISGETDMIIIKALPSTVSGNSFQIEAFAYHKGRWIKDKEINWSSSLAAASVNNTNLLTFSSSGDVNLTASLADRPKIKTTLSTTLVYDGAVSSISPNNISEIRLYPNPTYDNLYINGIDNASIELFSITGSKVFSLAFYNEGQPLSVSHLIKGMYIVKINGPDINKTIRFIKE